MNRAPGLIEACWRRIGVWGDERPRCAELEHVIHCRNCATFAAAARQMFAARAEAARPMSADAATALTDEVSATCSALLFRVGPWWLALPIALVNRIAPVGALHRLPRRGDNAVEGVVSVQGEIHACISLAQALGIDQPRATGGARVFPRLIGIGEGGWRVMFRACEVKGVWRYPPQALVPVGAHLPAPLAGVAAGVLPAEIDPGMRLECTCLEREPLIGAVKQAMA